MVDLSHARGRSDDASRLVKIGVSLSTLTTLRVGGPARFFAEPNDVGSLQVLLRWAPQNGWPLVVLGAGSNVLFPDRGFDGLVVRTTALRGWRLEGSRVWAAAGESFAGTAWWAARAGLAGLEWACGIPGTIGGAVVMNAGTRDGDTAGVLLSADVATAEEIRTLPSDELRLGYRTSAFLGGDPPGVLVGATLELRPDEPADCVRRARSTLSERARRLPVGASAGCVFRNPNDGPTAGELLDRAGCKGLRAGRAVVSAVHANVIVNEGSDNAADVLALIEEMKRRVLKAFGVELCEEVVIYP